MQRELPFLCPVGLVSHPDCRLSAQGHGGAGGRGQAPGGPGNAALLPCHRRETGEQGRAGPDLPGGGADFAGNEPVRVRLRGLAGGGGVSPAQAGGGGSGPQQLGDLPKAFPPHLHHPYLCGQMRRHPGGPGGGAVGVQRRHFGHGGDGGGSHRPGPYLGRIGGGQRAGEPPQRHPRHPAGRPAPAGRRGTAADGGGVALSAAQGHDTIGGGARPAGGQRRGLFPGRGQRGHLWGHAHHSGHQRRNRPAAAGRTRL